jgi:hypothetical protein
MRVAGRVMRSVLDKITAHGNSEKGTSIMLKKFVAPALALSLALGSVMTSAAPAHADRGARIGAGIAAGIIGLGVLGAYANARDRGHYRSSCYTVGGGCSYREGHCFYNRYGDYICKRGYQVCEPRRTICD